MSLILDALKKLDREKTFRWYKTANIAVEILRPDPSRRSKGVPMYIPAVLITAVFTAVITYALTAGFFSQSSAPPAAKSVPADQKSSSHVVAKGPTPESQEGISKDLPQSKEPSEIKSPATQASPASTVTTASEQEVTSAPPPREPVRAAPKEKRRSPPAEPIRAGGKAPAGPASLPPLAVSAPPAPAVSSLQQSSPVSQPREPARETRDEAVPLPRMQKQAEPAVPAAAPFEKRESQGLIPEESKIPPKAGVQQASKESAGPPSLRLSGVLWHEDPSERRAVVNGMVLSEGGGFEGVKVVEIHPTYVRFSYKDQFFEISMSNR